MILSKYIRYASGHALRAIRLMYLIVNANFYPIKTFLYSTDS